MGGIGGKDGAVVHKKQVCFKDRDVVNEKLVPLWTQSYALDISRKTPAVFLSCERRNKSSHELGGPRQYLRVLHDISN